MFGGRQPCGAQWWLMGANDPVGATGHIGRGLSPAQYRGSIHWKGDGNSDREEELHAEYAASCQKKKPRTIRRQLLKCDPGGEIRLSEVFGFHHIHADGHRRTTEAP